MSAHAEGRHEERLDQILAGSEDPRASFDASELAACDACRRVVDGVLDAERSLGRLGRLEEQRYAEYADTVEAREVLRGRAEARFEELVRGGTSAAPARGPARRVWLALAAAAAIVIVFSLARPWEKRTDPVLGTTLVRPTGEIDGASYGVFEWSARPAGGWFVVVVRDPSSREEEPVFTSRRIESQRWTPDPLEEAAWPDEIEWELQVFDGSGQLREVHAAEARRSR